MCVEAGFKAQIKGMLLPMVLEFHYSPSSPHMLSDMDCSALSIKEREQGTRNTMLKASYTACENVIPKGRQKLRVYIVNPKGTLKF